MTADDRAGTGRSTKRAGQSFWSLLSLAVLAAGWLSAALAADPSPLTGLQVAASGLVLIGAVMMAARVLAAVERARRSTASETPLKE